MPIRPEGPPTWPPDWPEVREAVEATLADGSWGRYHGPHCQRLEQALAEFHGVEEVLLCCSGTAAVELALHGARVGPSDEVILAAYDFKANFQNVLALGATPVLVDLDTADDLLRLRALPREVATACCPRTVGLLARHGWWPV